VGFTCVVSNFHGGVPRTAPSAAAVLSVTADVTPPVLVQATSLATNIVRAEFSEILLGSSVTALTNYVLTGPNGSVAVTSAALDPTGTNVLLLTGLLLQGSNYTLVVNGVRDNTVAQNPLAPNSTVIFRAETRPRLGSSFMSHRWSLSETPSTSTAGSTSSIPLAPRTASFAAAAASSPARALRCRVGRPRPLPTAISPTDFCPTPAPTAAGRARGRSRFG
jgi:hypothetical protein